MKLPMFIVGILVGAVLGTVGLVIYPLLGLLPPLLGICIGACVGGIAGIFTSKGLVIEEQSLSYLPKSTVEFITLVIKKMRYRKKVRADVQAELTAHFEDELKNCATDEEKEQKAQRLIADFGDVRLLAVLFRRAKKRCRPLWRTVVARTFQTVGVSILCLTAYLAWFFSGRPIVTVDYVAELNRLTRPVADESLNAAPLFEQAVAICPNMPVEKGNFWQKSFFDANEAERQVIEGWVQLCADSLNLIAQGAKRPYFWRQYKTSGDPNDDGSMMGVLLPHLDKFRKLARALCFRAQIQAAKGEYSPAFDDLIVYYKFGRLTSQGEKTIVEQLVGMGIQARAVKNIREILSHYPVGVEELTVLQTDFAEAQAGQEFRIRLLFEKLAMYDEIQRCFTKDRFGGGHLYLKRLWLWALSSVEISDSDSPAALAVRILFFHPNKAETRQKANECYDFFEETSKMSPAQLHEKSIDLNKQAESVAMGNNIFLRILMPALDSMYRTSCHLKADVQSVPVIIAALRFKIDKGQYPKDMAELQQFGYIKEVPMDPFSDQPLVYKRTVDNFTLYSVGPNFKDDGGQVYRDEKGILRLWHNKFGDTVFWPVPK